MDGDKARQKEARRTLKRIKGTLSKLGQGEGNASDLEESEEYRRMKDLLEHGYAHNKPKPAWLALVLLRHPVFFVVTVTLVLLLFM